MKTQRILKISQFYSQRKADQGLKAATKRKLQIRIVLVIGALIIAYFCCGLFFDQLNTLDSAMISNISDTVRFFRPHKIRQNWIN